MPPRASESTPTVGRARYVEARQPKPGNQPRLARAHIPTQEHNVHSLCQLLLDEEVGQVERGAGGGAPASGGDGGGPLRNVVTITRLRAPGGADASVGAMAKRSGGGATAATAAADTAIG